MELWAVSSDSGGAEGTEWASGQHLRCKHRQDHGKSSHTSLTTNTYLLIEPGQENCLFLQSMKWFSRLLPAWALPCCQCSGSSYREQTRLLKQGGYKNCYSWGQIFTSIGRPKPDELLISYNNDYWFFLFQKLWLAYIPGIPSLLHFWLGFTCEMSHLPQGPISTFTSQPHEHTSPSGDVIHFWVAPSSLPVCSACVFGWWDQPELTSLDVKS